jgi:hypothetical protein
MSATRAQRVPSREWYLLTTIIVLAAGALYLGGLVQCGRLGFPLDDGWIHQTYARNLARSGRLAYEPGTTSLGSTSPLWTLLLGFGYLLGLSPFPWTYVLGAACWLLIGWTGMMLAARLFPGQRSVAPWVGLACLLEWHMVWAAFSGMETALFTFLALLLIERYAARAHPFMMGLIGGLTVLARPEGVLLVGLVGAWSLLELASRSQRGRVAWKEHLALSTVDMAAGLVILLVPYLVFNEVVSGQLFPNTFYAKQAEYQALLVQPVWTRLWIVLRRTLVGAQVVLIPGFVWQAVRGWRVRASAAEDEAAPLPRGAGLLPICWWALYFVLYAVRLPVDYQYGRYLMPTIPVLLIYGISGSAYWLRPRSSRMAVRVLSRAAMIATAALLLAFLWIGGRTYAGDVCMINGEMVNVALWLDAHTAPDALIAAHDIGAIGYFGRRPLLDLAGLVTPEVVPFIRDEDSLLEFVVSEGADYVVTFPSWYPQMVADDRLSLVYQTRCQITRQRGEDNMAVYQIRR